MLLRELHLKSTLFQVLSICVFLLLIWMLWKAKSQETLKWEFPTSWASAGVTFLSSSLFTLLLVSAWEKALCVGEKQRYGWWQRQCGHVSENWPQCCQLFTVRSMTSCFSSCPHFLIGTLRKINQRISVEFGEGAVLFNTDLNTVLIYGVTCYHKTSSNLAEFWLDTLKDYDHSFTII